MNVLIISHGHPELNAGGGERAAYSLFQRLKSVEGVTPIFIARTDPRNIGHDGWFGAFRGRGDEFLWSPPASDWFRCVSNDPDLLQQQIHTIVERFRPHVTHLHHYFFFGLDAVQMFKEMSNGKVALTFHEYGLICAHNGQMIKRGSLRLCQTASSAECSVCFPEYSSGKFFLREKLAKQLIKKADAYVSPSKFLRDRYVEWGLEPEKFSVIENLLPHWFESLAPRSSERKEGKVRFGYFGQINPYKGARVLFDALRHLSESALERVEFVIFGANLESQSAEFQEEFKKQMEDCEGAVSFFGPYRNEDVPLLMSGVDWMIIPSVWWENSPVVIQEARASGTPILASNIGGMAEKVQPGKDGLHFLAGSAMDCASKIESILNRDAPFVSAKLDVSAQNTTAVDLHLKLYGAATAQKYAE